MWFLISKVLLYAQSRVLERAFTWVLGRRGSQISLSSTYVHVIMDRLPNEFDVVLIVGP